MIKKNIQFFIGLGISALAILLCYVYKQIIVYKLFVGLLFISILFSIFWKTKRPLFLGILTGWIIFIIYNTFGFLEESRKEGREIQNEYDNWEETASVVKPISYDRATEKPPLPSDATNIYSYGHSFWFGTFEKLLRFEASRESLLQYAQDVRNFFPEAAQYWIEKDIHPDSKIESHNNVSWFNVQDIRNGKLWSYDWPRGKDLMGSKVPTYYQSMVVDFDHNVFYLEQAD